MLQNLTCAIACLFILYLGLRTNRFGNQFLWFNNPRYNSIEDKVIGLENYIRDHHDYEEEAVLRNEVHWDSG
jgi:hypothetical protein